MIITFIAPIRFKEVYLAEYVRLSLKGYTVLLPVDVKDENRVTVDDKEEAIHDKLMSLHRQKLDMADIVYVIDYKGYKGLGTLEEIAYVQKLGKKLVYLSQGLLDCEGGYYE